MLRRGVPDDLAGGMAFLFTDDARFISGQVILVNGVEMSGEGKN
ncbi:MAG: hypothetical protein OXE02_10760 [Chloroflexi bacterium]|nr:hypothetical protein [Chloroflexota bacterium]